MGSEVEDKKDKELRYWLDIALRYFMAGVLGYIGYDWQTVKNDVRVVREGREALVERVKGVDDRLARIERLFDRDYGTRGERDGSVRP